MDNSVYLTSGDMFGLERLTEYIRRCPFSMARTEELAGDPARQNTLGRNMAAVSRDGSAASADAYIRTPPFDWLSGGR